MIGSNITNDTSLRVPLLSLDEQTKIKPYLSFFNKNAKNFIIDIPGYEKLREQYFKEVEAYTSKTPKCLPCVQGAIIRKYSRIILALLKSTI